MEPAYAGWCGPDRMAATNGTPTIGTLDHRHPYAQTFRELRGLSPRANSPRDRTWCETPLSWDALAWKTIQPLSVWDTIERQEQEALRERKRQLREKLIPIEGKPGFYHPNRQHALRVRLQGHRGQFVIEHFKLSASNGVSVVDQLKEVLAVNRVRVIDMFNSFDANSDGKVTRLELHRAFEFMGYGANPEAVDELFDSWDEDGSGALSFGELNHLLRQTGGGRSPQSPRRTATSIQSPLALAGGTPAPGLSGTPSAPSTPHVAKQPQHDQRERQRETSLPELEPIAAKPSSYHERHRAEVGEQIEGKKGFNHHNYLHSLRHEAHGARGQALDSTVKLDATDYASAAEQLKDLLRVNRVRVIDLFSSWDVDGNGVISRSEFHRAFSFLGYAGSPSVIDYLFASLDTNQSGTIDFAELNVQLRATFRPRKPHSPRAGLVSERSAELTTSSDSATPCAQSPLLPTVGSLVSEDLVKDLGPLRAMRAQLDAERRLWARRRQESLSRLQSLRWHNGKKMPAGSAPVPPPYTPPDPTRPFTPAPPQAPFALPPTEAIIDAIVHERLEASLRALQTKSKPRGKS